MSKPFQLSIDSPCHEKWSQMSPTQSGGFCASCQKEVIDFTSMTDAQIRTYFEKATGNICGRMRSHQLKRYGQPPSSRNKFISASLLSLSAFLSAYPTLAQTHITVSDIHADSTDSQTTKKLSAPQAYFITGRVIDAATGEGLPGTSVMLQQTFKGTVADGDGYFSLEIPGDIGTPMIHASFIGFETEVRTVNRDETEQNFQLNYSTAVLGEITGAISVRWWTPRGLWWRIKGIFY